jgi:hypothetical protein
MGNAGSAVNSKPAMASSEAIPMVAIAGSLLRYTIKLKLRLRRKVCLFNIGHLRDWGI